MPLSPADLAKSAASTRALAMVEDGMTLQQVQGTVYAYAGAFVVWCVAALVFAGFAMARRDWARRALMLTAAFSAGGFRRSSPAPKRRPHLPSLPRLPSPRPPPGPTATPG